MLLLTLTLCNTASSCNLRCKTKIVKPQPLNQSFRSFRIFRFHWHWHRHWWLRREYRRTICHIYLNYEDSENADVFDLAFATFFLNRTNRSGILGAGVIGGKSQDGKWTLAARFNKEKLIDRIRKIYRYRSRIILSNLDCARFIVDCADKLGNNSFTFFDPPYIERSSQLYYNKFLDKDHCSLAKSIEKIKSPWVVTYDLSALSLQLFKNHRRIACQIAYSAQRKYVGTEIMYFSRSLIVPNTKSLFHDRCVVLSKSRIRSY